MCACIVIHTFQQCISGLCRNIVVLRKPMQSPPQACTSDSNSGQDDYEDDLMDSGDSGGLGHKTSMAADLQTFVDSMQSECRVEWLCASKLLRQRCKDIFSCDRWKSLACMQLQDAFCVELQLEDILCLLLGSRCNTVRAGPCHASRSSLAV